MGHEIKALQQLTVIKAQSFSARFLGLHGIEKNQRQHTVLWFPQCRAVQSFFLTSQHTLVFLDIHYHVLSPYQIMYANRCYWSFKAVHAVELPALFSSYSHELLQSSLDILLSRARSV